MRVVELDRDMRDVIPTGTTRDSEFLFARMTGETLAAARPGPGKRVLDVASGLGQDAAALAERGAITIAAEPSSRMSELARLSVSQQGGVLTHWVRSWSDMLPFADDRFDAVICKGALDHFDRPSAAIAEIARVTKPAGTAVLAIANFDSLSCRVGRALDVAREGWFRRPAPAGRRGYDVPHDHFTRYELPLMREQAERSLVLEHVVGVSLGWGLPKWAQLLESLPEGAAQTLLSGLDWLAARAPSLADVVILAGRPRQRATTSA